MDVGRTNDLEILLQVLNGDYASCIEADIAAEHGTTDVNASILTLSKLTDDQGLDRVELDDKHLVFVPSKPNTNMSVGWMNHSLKIGLELTEHTVSIHELSMDDSVTVITVIFIILL